MAEQNHGYDDKSEKDPLIQVKEGKIKHDSEDEISSGTQSRNNQDMQQFPSETDSQSHDTAVKTLDDVINNTDQADSRPESNPVVTLLSPGSGNNNQSPTKKATDPFCYVCSIAFGICAVSICVSILAVNWTQMIYKRDESKKMVLGTLLSLCLLGIVCIVIAWICQYRCTCCRKNENDTDESTLTEVPTFKLMLFGVGDIIRCIIYTIYHIEGSGCSNSGLGITFNGFSIVFSVLLIIFLRRKPPKINNFLRVGISVASINRWLDTILSDTQGVFVSNDIDFFPILLNKTNHTAYVNCTHDEYILKTVHYTDIVLSPATVEFALIIIELLFIDNNTNEKRSTEHLNDTSRHTSNNECIEKSKNFLLTIACLVAAIIGGLACLSFIFSIVNTKKRSSEEYPTIFKVYVTIQSIMKIFMLLKTTACLLLARKQFSFTFGIGNVVLSISCFGNIVYHMFHCFALYKETIENSNSNNLDFINLSWCDNIVSILLAWVQTWFILGTHDNEKLYNNTKYELICNLNLLVGILNIGLWGGDSLGEARFPDLSFIIEKSYNEIFWNVLTKLILPLTIFFRFHTGEIQIKMYLDYKHGSKNAVI